jgi:crossover junction endodeoxyribonuclease RuvC
VVLLLAAEHGLEVSSYTPPQVKQAVTGSGGAPKEQVGYMVKALCGLAAVPTPADTADALAVALCHLNHAGLAVAGPGGGGGGTLGAASAADWLARAAPTSPGLARKGPR